MNYFSQKIEAFGLDFSELSIKIARLKKRSKGLFLSCFNEIALPPGVIEAGEVKDEKKLAEAIKQVIKRVNGSALKTEYVVSSLPEEKSFLDVLFMPLLKDKDLESAVMFEMENYIPVPLSEVYFDFQRYENVPNSAKVQEVLIAATPKKIVEPYLNALILAGLKPLAMEIESLSIARALIPQNCLASPTLIIDLGKSRTSFIIFFGRGLRFTSTISVSGQRLTDAVASKLKVSPEQAEILKVKEGLEGDSAVLQAIAPLLNELIAQIHSHSEYFYSHYSKNYSLAKEVKIEKILLGGGGANLRGLVNFIAQSLNLKAQLGDPWVNIFKQPLKDVPLLSYEQSLSYAAALGLALRGLDGPQKLLF